MAYPALDNYLKRMSVTAPAPSTVWLDSDGRAEGRFFNCILTSAFLPIRTIGDAGVVGFEGLARGVSAADAGLSLWKMLDHAASDDESVALDRLCRMLHAINFFRQPEAEDTDLYLSVHDRLLSGVSSNHGYAFRRILKALGLPNDQIVLQLPAVSASRRWLVNYVADNYRRNGFRLALQVGSIAEAVDVLTQVRPDAVKIDARAISDDAGLERLLLLAQAGAAKLVFKRVASQACLAMLERASANTGVAAFMQGPLMDAPRAALRTDAGTVDAPRQRTSIQCA